jgi:hypothetical protein
MVPPGRSCQHDGVHELPTSTDSGGLERRRRGGELTAAERAVRRKNRRWMTVIAVPALILGAGALVAALLADSGGSSVHPVTVPPGFRAISDGYFAYAVPATWSQSSAYTDDVGDLDTQGASGWVAEHLAGRISPPGPNEAAPAVFATFGEPRPVPYQLGPATLLQVKGAAVAYRYPVTRPDGFRAVAVDAWQSRSGAEIWLLVHTDTGTTNSVISSLSG